jgi:predicted dehydrogenase
MTPDEADHPSSRGDHVTEPLRVGILGAARISDLALIGPAHDLGVQLVAVATRDRRRAEAYAAMHGVESVHDTYADVIADPRVEAVYNPLPNNLHAPWNLEAIAAGKHVLTEKPSASNTSEAIKVDQAAVAAGVTVFEGFHYRYHPQFARLAEILSTGELGRLERVDVTMAMPAPAVDDLRWSWPLSGGAMMDLGCYCLHVIRSVSGLFGGEPRLTHAVARERDGLPQIDERFEAEFRMADGSPAFAHVNMDSDGWEMSIQINGADGSLSIPDYMHPNDDDRILLNIGGDHRIEHTSPRTTYTYQLEAFVAAVREGRAFPTDTADSIATMKLIDACYDAAGLRPRGVQ